MGLRIVRNDIVHMHTDVIVNTANPNVVVGSGCDMAIYKGAGYEELLEYRKKNIGIVSEGDVFMTPGFHLPSKYIIHAVGPHRDHGSGWEKTMIRQCYRKCLNLALEYNIQSISFPLLSTGNLGYSKEDGLRIAIDEINAFLLKQDMDIYLVVYDQISTSLGKKLYPDLQSYIDENYVCDQKVSAYSSRISIRPTSVQNFGCGFKEDIYIDLKSSLDKRKAHLADSFSEYLLYLIQSKGMKNTDVYKRAILDKKLFAKIKNNPMYHPQKLTCLQLCVGAKLNVDETKDLLSRAGYALSPSDMRDVIFAYFIEHEIYDMLEIDIQLEEYGLPCIIE